MQEQIAEKEEKIQKIKEEVVLKEQEIDQLVDSLKCLK
jgi:cell division protein FtsB